MDTEVKYRRRPGRRPDPTAPYSKYREKAPSKPLIGPQVGVKIDEAAHAEASRRADLAGVSLREFLSTLILSTSA